MLYYLARSFDPQPCLFREATAVHCDLEVKTLRKAGVEQVHSLVNLESLYLQDDPLLMQPGCGVLQRL